MDGARGNLGCSKTESQMNTKPSVVSRAELRDGIEKLNLTDLVLLADERRKPPRIQPFSHGRAYRPADSDFRLLGGQNPAKR